MKNKIIYWLIISVINCASAYANLQNGADKLINQVSPTINIGAQVVDLTTGTTIFQRNQNKLFIPASNMKLFSDAAVLMVFGPDYKFRNQLSVGKSQLKNGELTGHLYLKLLGDPSFNYERLVALLSILKTWHIKTINGNVIIASDHNNISPYASGWQKKDLIYSYSAPLAPLIVDANRIVVIVNPSNKPEKPAIIEIANGNNYIKINNQVKTKVKSARCGVSFLMNNNNELTVRGCVVVQQLAVQQEIAVRNPLFYTSALIKQALNSMHININGQIKLGSIPNDTMLLSSDFSKPIAQLMADTLKPSDNLYADSLFLHAAAKLKGSPVNWQEAQNIIKKFLQQQTGIQLQNAILTDGSGLSRNDKLTPAQTVSLLRFLYNKFPLAYEYISALPISGRDGTLQKRFKRPGQQDLVRAKTGTMTGVVSLSGYLYTLNGHTLAFTFFINNVAGTKLSVSGRYRSLIDSLCAYFLRQSPNSGILTRLFNNNHSIKYQQNPTQAELKRNYQAKWRRLESMIKHALLGQSVTIIFRDNELILYDNQNNMHQVLNALRTLRNKYPFSVALISQDKPVIDGKPLVLWHDSVVKQRSWIIHELTI